MLFNLAIKNIKKSIKDYSIYFFTLVTAVAIFYVFNSLDAQESMLVLNSSKTQIIKGLVVAISYVSVFISVILGFLIVYANTFILKRRKKEFGLYLTLGMSKSKVSIILVYEALIVGVLSLLVGLGVGVIFSQFLSLITAKLFEVDMNSFRFVFSTTALCKTLLYFSLIYVLVLIFNVISLSRNKVINLLNADKKNEKIKFRNKYIIFIAFVLCVLSLYYTYYLLYNGALFSLDNKFLKLIIFGTIGTFLLYFSVSGFFLSIISRFKKVYYKKLNMFIFKQVNSKANSTVISTTLISIMLLLTIGILSCAISMVSIFNNSMKDNNISDITIIKYNDVKIDNYKEYLKNEVEPTTSVLEISRSSWFKDYAKNSAYYYSFASDLTYRDLLSPDCIEKLTKELGQNVMFDSSVEIISVSDFNNVLSLYGLNTVSLKDNQYLLTANNAKLIKYYDDYYYDNNISVNNHYLKPSTNKVYNISLINYPMESNLGTIVVPDKIVNGLHSLANTLLVKYIDTDNVKTIEDNFTNKIFNFGELSYMSKLDMYEASIGTKVIAIFLGLYIGIIFAIASATILAIGQLSESSDNKKRYLVLKQIGADEKIINKSLFAQISIAFISPLIVAIIHAYFALGKLNNMFALMGEADISKSTLLVSIFMLVIYGGYFYVTYLCSKNIIKEK